MRIARVLTAATVAAFPLAALAVGCGDDTTGSSTVTDASMTSSATSSATSTGTGTSTVTTSATSTVTSTATSTATGMDSGADASDGAVQSLYVMLGGHTGIRAKIDAVVAQELMDPEIASYFFNQTASPIPGGHPNSDQLSECFTDLLSKIAGGPELYPTTVTDDAGMFTCRADMVAIHKSLNISGGTFDKFIMIAATELGVLGVSPANITTIGGALVSTKPAIVTAALADAGEIPYSPNTGDGGLYPDLAPDASTLYARLGQHLGVRAALNAIVAQELTDPEIASYFFNQTASPVPTGHPTVDQLTECLTSLLGGAAGGPEDYPLAVVDDAGSFTCRDLVTIHTPLHISGGTFDTFVTIAAGELMNLGVTALDITTIGGVLNSTKGAIVQADLFDAGELPYDAARE